MGHWVASGRMLGLNPGDVGLFVNPSDPRLSPDGSRVVFSVQRVDMEHNRYPARIWVAATDGGSAAVAISPEAETTGLPRWSPDGSTIAYATRPLDDDDAVTEIRVVDAAGGGEPRTVCVCPSEPSELEWSPDGVHLAFVARDPDRDRYGAPGETRKEKDMPPRRIERLFTRLDSVGWISDRPSRVRRTGRRFFPAARAHDRQLRGERGCVVTRRSPHRVRVGPARLVGPRLGGRSLRRRRLRGDRVVAARHRDGLDLLAAVLVGRRHPARLYPVAPRARRTVARSCRRAPERRR